MDEPLESTDPVALREEIERLHEEVDALRDRILGDPGVSCGPASFRGFQAIPSYAVRDAARRARR